MVSLSALRTFPFRYPYNQQITTKRRRRSYPSPHPAQLRQGPSTAFGVYAQSRRAHLVLRTIVAISVLMVEGNAIGLVFGAISAGATVKLSHLGAGTGTASEVGISTDRSQRGSPSGKVVVGDRLKGASIVTVV